MSRTVVGFELLGTQTVFKLEDAPTDIPGMLENAPCDVSPLPAGSVTDRGSALASRLRDNPAVSAGLDQLLAQPPTADPSPLYFHVVARSADDLPWEQLYAPGLGFWALDRRWPVGRISRRRRPLADRAFTPPFTILAVLSAAGQSGVRQVRALLKSTEDPALQAMGVHLHVLSAEEAVLAEVAAVTIAQDGEAAPLRTNVTSETLAGTVPGVLDQITKARPQVVHMLCHGGATAGVRTLALATLADHDAGEVTGSVRLRVSDLTAALIPSDPWLVVLAACESAQAADGPALAHDLVDSGLPAVIGMRRLVDLATTNRFCDALYPEVMRAVLVAATANGAGTSPAAQVRILDWATCLTGPRAALGGTDPSQGDAWADPVLYAQEDPLRVFPPSPQLSPADYAGIKAELDVYMAYRRSLDAATAPPGLIDEVDARIAAKQAMLGDPPLGQGHP